MKNIKKISIIIMILLVTGCFFSNYSQASGWGWFSSDQTSEQTSEIGNIFSSADKFLDKGDSPGSVINQTQLRETSGFIYKLLLSIGIIVMFIVGTILGIQFMVASAEDKAKVKEALVPYIIGCFVIFGAFSIWSTAVNIGQGRNVATYTVRRFCIKCDENLMSQEGLIIDCPYCEKTTWVATEYTCNHCGEKIDSGLEMGLIDKKCPNCKYYFD